MADDTDETCELCGGVAHAKLTLEAFLDLYDGDALAASEEWTDLFELIVCTDCAAKPDARRTLLRLAADAADDDATDNHPHSGTPGALWECSGCGRRWTMTEGSTVCPQRCGSEEVCAVLPYCQTPVRPPREGEG